MVQPLSPASLAAEMDVALIDSLPAFDALGPGWDRLCARDPEASIFLSWEWLRQAFEANPARWSVLVATSRSTGALLGALPLKFRLHWSRSRSRLQTELESGARLGGAPYAGLLCEPDLEAQVLERMAAALLALPWTRMNLAYVHQRRRLDVLAGHLGAAQAEASVVDPATAGPETRMASRVLTLPQTFPALLSAQVSAAAAAAYDALSASSANAAGAEAPRLSLSDAEGMEDDFAALYALAKERRDTRARARLKAAKPAMRIAAAQDRLVMPMLWRGGTLAGGALHVLDPRDNSLLQLASAARDDAEDGARTLVTLAAMERGIAAGAEFFDFGRVGSRPTRAFATETEPCHSLSVSRDPGADLVFDPICTGAAMRRISDFIAEGRHGDAAAACAQLADLLP